MSYWWVNHSQTSKAELDGGYLWSPTKKKNGSHNEGYKNMTSTRVGDLVFSFSDGLIKAIGVVKVKCVDSSVPEEFGAKAEQWNKDGYLVKVDWERLESSFRVKININKIKDLLPAKHSPIQQNGNGNQGIYLAAIHEELGDKLIRLINEENEYLKPDIEDTVRIVEEEAEEDNIKKSDASPTEKQQLIKARIGQGKFRNEVIKIEKTCRVTKIYALKFLTDSHIQPWCKSSNFEKLDGNNGLLLSPHIDKLFDQGWISFEDNGDIMISQTIPTNLLMSWGVDVKNVGAFNKKQIVYLEYHRKNRFKDSKK